MSGSNQYLAINFGNIEIKRSYPNDTGTWFRNWRQLTRFQRRLFYIFAALLIIYILSRLQFYQSTLEEINTKRQSELIGKLVKISKKNESAAAIETTEKLAVIKHDEKPVKFKGPSNERQQKVVDAFLHAWKGYKEHAWGKDELRPLSKTSSSWFNLGLTIIDSLDTIYIMNLQEQFHEAVEWVKTGLDLNADRYNNLFEITIRILGGLLSAFHLSAEKVLLEKAYDLSNRTLVAFNTSSMIPLSDVNLARRLAKSPSWTADSSISEAATLQIELNDLSNLTGDSRFSQAGDRVNEVIHKLSKPDGLVPIFIDTNSGRFTSRTITLGARGDSYYEYLLKQWIQHGAVYNKSHPYYYLLEDWLSSLRGIKTQLVRLTKPSNLTFVGEISNESFSPKMDHLVCFLPGNLALGYMYLRQEPDFPKNELDEMLELAKSLTETCYQMYAQMPTGLSPEIVYFNTFDSSSRDIVVKDADRHNLLRPETVESLYYMRRVTGEKKYEEYGWKIFEAFEKYTKVEGGGYTSISDVMNVEQVRPRDKMESFFLAETLKYLYLLFEDEVNLNSVDLFKWLFNTEAHLITILK